MVRCRARGLLQYCNVLHLNTILHANYRLNLKDFLHPISTNFSTVYNHLRYSEQCMLAFDYSVNNPRTYINDQIKQYTSRQSTTPRIACSYSANFCSICCKFHSLLIKAITYSQDLSHLLLILSQSQSLTPVIIKNVIFCTSKS